MLGPNVKRLICHKLSAEIVPPGSGSSAFGNVVEFLQSPYALTKGFRAATEWVQTAIRAVKEAPGGEAYGDDEAIAGEILRQIDERKKQHRKQMT